MALSTAKIFISYRRTNGAGYAGRLHDNLTSRLAAEVFVDVDDIPPGVHYSDYIERTVRRCDVLLALIGPGWADERDEGGHPRLEDTKDFVRREIVAALRNDVLVIPVLFANAPLPERRQLPDDLIPLLERQALTLTDDQWQAGVSRLLAAITAASPTSIGSPALSRAVQVFPTTLDFGTVKSGTDWPCRQLQLHGAEGDIEGLTVTADEPWIALLRNGSVVDVLVDPSSAGTRRGTVRVDAPTGSVDVTVQVTVEPGLGKKPHARGGLLLASGVILAVVVGQRLLTPDGPHAVDVPAEVEWVDSGVTLEKGQRAVVTATGRVLTDPVRHPDERYTPQGAPQTGASPGDPVPNVNHAALLGRVGSQLFFIGAGPTTVSGMEGRLMLRVNDDGVADNVGKYRVIIRVTTAERL